MSDITLTGTWLALAEALGGPAKLAEHLGISRMTLWRWAAGKTTPHLLMQAKVNGIARRRGLKEPF